MANFILIQFGENEELMMNPNCRQIIFMDYLRTKCQYDKGAIIDLIDENGNLSMVHMAKPDENVRGNFEDRVNYVPVLLEKGSDDITLKKVKPLLNDWEKRFPQLEKKIKILTGEIKRRKSPTRGVLEPNRGRGLDRRASKHSDRSASNMGRASVTQSRFSSAKLATAPSVSGRVFGPGKADKKGSKVKGKRK